MPSSPPGVDAAAVRIPAGAKLDLGCGTRKRTPAYVGIDRRAEPGVDVVGDVVDVLDALPDGWVSEVFSSHFLEHVEDVPATLGAMARVLVPGGRLEILVPHFSNPYFYSDLTHRHPFGLYSLCYLLEGSPFKRRVPRYSEALPLELIEVKLRFKSSPPFYGRHAVKRTIELLVNLGRGAQEFYEENLCWLLPCYELQFVARRR